MSITWVATRPNLGVLTAAGGSWDVWLLARSEMSVQVSRSWWDDSSALVRRCASEHGVGRSQSVESAMHWDGAVRRCSPRRGPGGA